MWNALRRPIIQRNECGQELQIGAGSVVLCIAVEVILSGQKNVWGCTQNITCSTTDAKGSLTSGFQQDKHMMVVSVGFQNTFMLAQRLPQPYEDKCGLILHDEVT